MASVTDTTPTGAISTRKGFLGQRRKAKFALRSIAIFFSALIMILAGVDLAKYPPDYDYGGNTGLLPALLLMPTAGVTIIWSTIDIVLLLVRGDTAGLHPLAVAILDTFIFVGCVVEFIMLLVLRSVVEVDDGSQPFTSYQDGDEYMWSAFAFHVLLTLTLIVVFSIGISENKARRRVKWAQAKHKSLP